MKKTLKIIGIILGIVLILLFAGQWWLANKIEHTIQDKVAEKTGGKIRVDIGRVSVRLIGRKVLFRDIKITTDTTIQPKKSGLPFENVDAEIRQIAVKGIHFNKKDSVHYIKVRELDIDIPKGSALSKKQSGNIHSSAPDPALNRLKAVIEAQNIHIHLDDIQYHLAQSKDTVGYYVRHFNWKVTNAQLNTANSQSCPPMSCDDMELSMISFRNLFAEKSQLLKIDSLFIKGKAGSIEVGSINLIPQYSKHAFAEKAPGHTDWTKVQTGKIKCHQFDMQRLMTTRIVAIDSISISSAEISSYKNRQIEQAKRVKKLFYESIQQFPLPLTIRTIRMDNIQVEYQELAKNGITPGTVTFNQLNGTFDSLTNIVTPAQPYFTLRASGKLMNRTLLKAIFRLPVDSLNPRFEVKGNLGKMNMEDLNPVIVPLAKIKITSGEIESMTFDITGNSEESKVNMVLLYRDLKIRLMKEKDGHLKTRSFLTTLANGLIATGNNPQTLQDVRQAEATAKRDIYRSQFNYLWRTLLAGIKISIGL